MGNIEIERLIGEAQSDSGGARQRLILHYKPYILNVVSYLCKRFITWSDEEASIGLLAFNYCINTYNPEGRQNFLPYVYAVIKKDLMNRGMSQEISSSQETLQQQGVISKLAEEILEFDEALKDYEIGFEELEAYTPSHKNTRQMLITISEGFIKSKNLVGIFKDKKKMPITELAHEMGFDIKVLEKHRKYLITLILVGLNPEWVQLSFFIKGAKGEKDNE